MMITKILGGGFLAFSLTSAVSANPVTVLDLASLTLGAAVNGPVGVTVDSGFDDAGLNYGDFSGGAICPAGFITCIPPANPAGTIYTYVQSITPFADPVPNDGPFPNASGAGTPGNINFYGLGFDPAGVNGVAGYDFAQASAAGVSFGVHDSGSGITWTTQGGDWSAGETISFFFQTTQGPSGPGGVYQIGNGTFTAAARGPLPAALPAPVPLPAGALFMATALAGFAGMRRRPT